MRVCGSSRMCREHPSPARARLHILGGVWFGPGAPGVALGGDPRPGLCIGRESLNASRAGDRLENLQPGSWQCWAPTGALVGQGSGWDARGPLPAARAAPGEVSRQMLPWSSTSDPLSPKPFFLLFLFPSFPPHRASILETNFKTFFYFLSW